MKRIRIFLGVLAALAALEPFVTACGSDPAERGGASNAGGRGATTGDGGQAGAASGLAQASLVLDPNGAAPLAAELTVQFEGHGEVEVEVDGDDAWTLSSEGDDGATLSLLGLKAASTYSVTVTVTTPEGSEVLAPLQLSTAPLPASFPALEVRRSRPGRMAPGNTLVCMYYGYLFIVDEAGDVVWYTPVDRVSDAQLLPNGNLLFIDSGAIIELTLLGKRVRFITAMPDDVEYHHDVTPLDDGGFLTLGSHVGTRDFPTDYDDLTVRDQVHVADGVVLELDRSGSVVWRQPLLEVLDPNRLGYDSLDSFFVGGYDWAHANAVRLADEGSSLIVSSRHQDAVFKMSRDGKLRWLLAPKAGWSEPFQKYLLEPVPSADDFIWPAHQHSPEPTPDGTLMLFDNGVYRATPGDGNTPLSDEESFSRAVEYRIDEEAMTIEELWSYQPPDGPLFAKIMGSAELYPESNTVLIDYPYDPAHARLIEVDRDEGDEIVFDMLLTIEDPRESAWSVYRVDRIPSLR